MTPGGPDPLGKRALYWMPVEAEAGDDVDTAPEGWSVDGSDEVSSARGATRTPPHARPAGKRALYSDATPADEAEPARASVTTDDPLPHRGILSVSCSQCGSVSRVGLVEFLVLQFPVGVWLPRRTFDRWMTCPACRRRTWASVTFAR